MHGPWPRVVGLSMLRHAFSSTIPPFGCRVPAMPVQSMCGLGLQWRRLHCIGTPMHRTTSRLATRLQISLLRPTGVCISTAHSPLSAFFRAMCAKAAGGEEDGMLLQTRHIPPFPPATDALNFQTTKRHIESFGYRTICMCPCMQSPVRHPIDGRVAAASNAQTVRT
eukprot:1302892-Pleurochrysis_carterae.AAC.1